MGATAIEEEPSGTLSIMGPGGHMEIRWKADQPESVKTAQRAFTDLLAKGYTAFRMNADGSTGERLQTFDAKAGEVVLVGPIAGG